MKTLAVDLPRLEQAAVIADFHRALTFALAPISDRYSWSVMYVVDRSTDGTLEILNGMAASDPRMRILSLPLASAIRRRSSPAWTTRTRTPW